MQRPSYALALLLASLASCMVIANVAQCQVIVVFHDVSEGTDEPAATVIDSGSNASAAENSSAAESAENPDSADLPPANDELSSEENGVNADVISDEPAIPVESPAQTEIDAEIAPTAPVGQPYDLPGHSRVCPYSGDWLDYGVLDYADSVVGNGLRDFSNEPTLDEQVADVPAPTTEEAPLRSAEIQAVEEDAIIESGGDGTYQFAIESAERPNQRDAALKVAATLDRIGSWLHEVSGEIRDWASEGEISDDESTGEVELGATESSDETSQYDESTEMIEQLE